MTDTTPEAAGLDARLADIDRKLREIQGELAPAAPGGSDGAAPGASDGSAQGGSDGAAPAAGPSPRVRAAQPAVAAEQLDQQIARLTALHTSLLSSLTEVLGQLQAALGQLRRSTDSELSISVGPFASLEAVRQFERELARLPGVRGVAVRGYEGDDRAVVDVQLASPDGEI